MLYSDHLKIISHPTGSGLCLSHLEESSHSKKGEKDKESPILSNS